MKPNATAIFDIGKTNKKCIIFDDTYNVLAESSTHLPETTDEDGFPCESLDVLEKWLKETLGEYLASNDFEITRVNFATYGATLVFLDGKGKPLTALGNYLKPFPEKLRKVFESSYSKAGTLEKETASPMLGMLNAGLQIFALKQSRPDTFAKVEHIVHFPQYLSSLFTGQYFSEFTMVGCHTFLWNFAKNSYHNWVDKESISHLLPPLKPASFHQKGLFLGKEINFGIGLHDSSSALVPYLLREKEPFVLISTGTWSISLCPFNDALLTQEELDKDVLCYLTHQGKAVKAARLFLGKAYERAKAVLNKYFLAAGKEENLVFSAALAEEVIEKAQNLFFPPSLEGEKPFPNLYPGFQPGDWAADYAYAYHQLNFELAALQAQAVKLAVGKAPVKRVIVAGGFFQNPHFLYFLRQALAGFDLQEAKFPRSTALGAAMVLGTS